MEHLENVTTVGYQGVPGAYSEEALLAFQPDARPISYRTLPELFAALGDGLVQKAFVPIENSHAGSVVEAYDLMVEYEVTIEAEAIHPVHHSLLGVPGATPSEIERVFSHPQALAQTAAFLQEARLTTEPYYDTAGAAQMVAERQDPRLAAVASRLAGERYGLAVLAEGIQTSVDNATRFFLIRAGLWEPDPERANNGAGKTTLAFSVEHRPGTLVRALTSFSRQHVNLARLESRPSRRRPWEYLFFTDVEGYAEEAPVRAALRELTRLNPFVRVLGSYLSASPSRQADGGVPS
jgi:prephenate dehydratase